MAKKAMALDEAVDRFIRFMSDPTGKLIDGTRVDLNLFRDPIPILPQEMFPHDYDEDIMYDPETRPADLPERLNISTINTFGDEDEPEESMIQTFKGGKTEFSLQRARYLDHPDFRGRTKLFLPHMVQWDIVGFFASGKRLSATTYLGSYDNRGFLDVSARLARVPYMEGHYGVAIDKPGVSDEYSLRVGMMCAIQKVERQRWHVSLGYVDSPRVAFSTDPYGVREVFRLRDIPEGKKRRQALHHWVTEHWRKKRSDASAKTFVRRHLRGALNFVWNGLQCHIQPSVTDALENEWWKRNRDVLADAISSNQRIEVVSR